MAQKTIVQADVDAAVKDKALPIEALAANEATAAATDEARTGGLQKFYSIDDLMADLHADD